MDNYGGTCYHEFIKRFARERATRVNRAGQPLQLVFTNALLFREMQTQKSHLEHGP